VQLLHSKFLLHSIDFFVVSRHSDWLLEFDTSNQNELKEVIGNKLASICLLITLAQVLER